MPIRHDAARTAQLLASGRGVLSPQHRWRVGQAMEGVGACRDARVFAGRSNLVSVGLSLSVARNNGASAVRDPTKAKPGMGLGYVYEL